MTWTTGAPLWDQRPTIWWTPVTYTAFYVTGLLVAGLGLGVAALSLPLPLMMPLLVVSWLLTSSAVREYDVIVIHICVHKLMFRSPLANRAFAEFLSTVLWRMSYDDNYRIHVSGHHHNPCTEEDDDVKFLRWSGFRPGFTRAEFHRYLLKTLFSPFFYAGAFAFRVRASFKPSLPRYRLAMSIVYLVAVALFLWATGWWFEWLVLWAFPVVVLLQAQALMSTLSEHRWWMFRDGGRLTKERLAQLTFGRFSGDPAPPPEGPRLARAPAWARWWARLIFFHVPYRLFVLVGDLSQHDIHHRSGRFNMVNPAYLRRDDLRSGAPNWPGYREVWGGMLTHMYAAVELADRPSPPILSSALPAEYLQPGAGRRSVAHGR